jgi:hypothetical protein
MLLIHDANSFILTGLDAGEIIRGLSPKPLPLAAVIRAVRLSFATVRKNSEFQENL